MRRSGLRARGLGPESLALQPWRGQIRELRHTLEQAALMADDLVLETRRIVLLRRSTPTLLKRKRHARIARARGANYRVPGWPNFLGNDEALDYVCR